MKNMIVVAGLVCSSFSSAYATGTDVVYITGSSAFRGQLMSYLRGKLTNTRATFDKTPSTTDLGASVDASSFIVMSGNWDGSSTRTTFFLSFTGSVAGIRDVAGPVAQTFLVKPADFETTSGYLLNISAPYGGLKTTVTKDGDGLLVSPAFSHEPDFGFTDVYQASTIYTNPLTDTPVAVVPFTWVTASGGATAGITNMTPQIAQTLFKTGKVSLSLFSGLLADDTAGTMVYALGRTSDSGTRMSAMAETGVGVSTGLHQYKPVGSPTVTSYTDVGDGGYASGSDLSTNMKLATTAANGFNVSYMGISDADTTTNATYLSHNGVLYSSTLATAIDQVTQGKYTFWCYEHLIDRGDLTELANTDALKVLNNLKTDLATSFPSSRKTIRLDAMRCLRTTDGDTVYHY